MATTLELIKGGYYTQYTQLSAAKTNATPVTPAEQRIINRLKTGLQINKNEMKTKAPSKNIKISSDKVYTKFIDKRNYPNK
ncbi:hypothetical protein CHS0354_009713 [Potamilus streckersoni]|uniref:Uncharacterized protein n=1 Tax=Potamilus streckersoni TaxID=2493646 RepID=A0AAE0S020_9BIVA|nr:hypothetical protein CHS0354_009713 [Potamilus streckersoni]